MPDKHEVDGSIPFEPTSTLKNVQIKEGKLVYQKQSSIVIYNKPKTFRETLNKCFKSKNDEVETSSNAKFILRQDKMIQKREMQGKRTKYDEIVHKYIEEYFEKFNEAVRSFSSILRLSYKERRVNAQAPRAEEGRDKLRKAMGRSKYPFNHRYPNEETQLETKIKLFIYK